jgi:hypothetical protein
MQNPITRVIRTRSSPSRSEKKKKQLDACLEQRKHYTPFVISTDGLVGRKAAKLLKRLALRLTEKWERP